jgi:N-methylhydantoinase B/oxoprolinase/acetone carboxylase alpha subunit
VPEVTVSALLNRMKTEPWGVLGGGEGAVGGLWVRRAGNEEWRTFVEEFGTVSPSKFSGVTLRTGDQVKILMPGGGGYGDPARRERASVRRDVEEGFVSDEVARTVYGFDGQGV